MKKSSFVFARIRPFWFSFWSFQIKVLSFVHSCPFLFSCNGQFRFLSFSCWGSFGIVIFVLDLLGCQCFGEKEFRLCSELFCSIPGLFCFEYWNAGGRSSFFVFCSL